MFRSWQIFGFISAVVCLTVLLPACHDNGYREPRRIARTKKAYSGASFEYEQELTLLANKNLSEKQLREKLHKLILVKNDEYNADQRGWFTSAAHEDYPYIQYRQRLENTLSRLQRMARHLDWTENDLNNCIYRLIKQLARLKKLVITANEYSNERKQKAKQDTQQNIARATWWSAYESGRTADETRRLANETRRAANKKPDVAINIHETHLHHRR